MRTIVIIILVFSKSIFVGQHDLTFDGQVSALASYGFSDEAGVFAALRYIPEVNYKFKIDSFSSLDFEASLNLNLFWDAEEIFTTLSPYRLWARYSGKQYEIRAGIQKIEFGSASILRPLQWFNQIDPRDPLQLTNGVNALLGRYYFLNNANVWLWGLYGNEAARGFDPLESIPEIPEYGGRIQYPIPKGEVGLTYHHRTARYAPGILSVIEEIPENRIGLDGKWDVGVGLWFEAAQSWKGENIGLLTYQSSLNVGMDYTFGLGNGLGMILEHMLISLDEELFAFETPIHFTAATVAYPIGFFDNVNAVFFYSWNTGDPTFFLNYEHQFPKFSLYVMAYYNPETVVGVQQNDLVYSFAGPGVRLMGVYVY